MNEIKRLSEDSKAARDEVREIKLRTGSVKAKPDKVRRRRIISAVRNGDIIERDGQKFMAVCGGNKYVPVGTSKPRIRPKTHART